MGRGRLLHRSSTTASLALLWLAHCSNGADVVSRNVTSHVSSRCTAPNNPFGTFRGEGDFQASGENDLFLSKVDATLDQIPNQSRELVTRVSDSTNATWVGVAPIGKSGDVDVFLWPSGSPCALSATVGQIEVGSRSVGLIDSAHVLSLGGFPVDLTQPRSFVVDLGVGRIRSLPIGPTTPRANASVTAFAGGAIVAGGFRSDDKNGVLASAEIYDSRLGDFDGKPITLGIARAKHGAVTLADGRTVLIGGVGGSARSVELVDPVTRRSTLDGMPILKAPRTSPLVARLASGEVLVAGGVDANGTPVASLEVLSNDGKNALALDLTIPARHKQAMIDLEGGGALFVIAPEVGDTDFQNVWVLSASKSLSGDAGARVQGALTDPRLFHGASGKPVLWTGDRWLAWDSWRQVFVPFTEALGSGPDRENPILSPDPGLLLWITDVGDVIGRRVSTRETFTSELLPLLVKDTALMAPDSPFALGAFDVDRGLSLAPGTSAFLSDARFLEASVDVDGTQGLPIVVLRAASGREVELGGGACPWPVATVPNSFHVEARGGLISYGSAQRATCSWPFASGERFAIGLRGGPARAKNLRVLR